MDTSVSLTAKYSLKCYSSSRQQSPAMSRRPQYLLQVNGTEQQRVTPQVGSIPQLDQSPRQRAFLDDVIARRAKLVQVTYDRVAQNSKELTVSRGEFLEASSTKFAF